MEMNIKDFSKKISKRVRENLNILMAIFTKETLNKITKKAKVPNYFMMEINMRECGIITKEKVIL